MAARAEWDFPVMTPLSVNKWHLLYSWRFSRYRAPIHWLAHGHMTSNNETVSRQMRGAGNIAKTMTPNRKQFTLTREMLTAVARHLSIKWSFVFHRIYPFVLLHNKSLNIWSLGKLVSFVFPRVRMFPSTSSRENKTNCFPRDHTLSVYCCLQAGSKITLTPSIHQIHSKKQKCHTL